jgi:hypothetical protein
MIWPDCAIGKEARMVRMLLIWGMLVGIVAGMPAFGFAKRASLPALIVRSVTMLLIILSVHPIATPMRGEKVNSGAHCQNHTDL